MPPGHSIPALSWQHLAALALLTILTAISIKLARRTINTPREKILRRSLATLGLITFTTSCIFYILPDRRDWSVSLPIQMCDLVALIAPLAILTAARTLRTLLHFWGFALCTQFFFTPVHAPGTTPFIIGWLLHGGILLLAITDAAGLRYKPARRDLAFALIAGTLYAAIMFTLNRATGFNYGYVGPTKPGTPTIVDALGPYPLRVLWIILIAATALCIVMLINTTLRRAQKH